MDLELISISEANGLFLVRLNTERYLIRQDTAIYKFSIK